MIDRFKDEYEFLSNFYASPISVGGITYPTVEHAFQAHKVMSYGIRKSMATESSPGRAKRRGRLLDLRPDWDSVKVGIMAMLLEQKFQDPDLRRMLLDTGNHLIVESNSWHDQFWGSCYCVIHRNKQGENILGQLLMTRRGIEQKKYGGM